MKDNRDKGYGYCKRCIKNYATGPNKFCGSCFIKAKGLVMCDCGRSYHMKQNGMCRFCRDEAIENTYASQKDYDESNGI